jgi:magnesium chelatase family protein
MLASATGCTLAGVEGFLVEVQVDLRGGLPGLYIVGLPDRAVSEAARRVRAAIGNSDFRLPPRKITVNLAPADLPKHGAALDLPIAVALLAACGHLPAGLLEGRGFWGQLSLDGSVRAVPGALPAATAMRRQGLRELVVSADQAAEAALSGLGVRGLRRLGDLLDDLRRPDGVFVAPAGAAGGAAVEPAGDRESELAYLAVRGQSGAVRALEVAAAGGHSLLLTGPPGVGKSLLARALHALLPGLDGEEYLEAATVASAWGAYSSATGPAGARQAPGGGLAVAPSATRPLRSPPHTAGLRAMLGGGGLPFLGEATLAHRGVLLLDELPLFRPDILNALVPAMDRGFVALTWHGRPVCLPASFQLVATANLCPCGRSGSLAGGCACTPAARKAYWRRVSGQLLDRLDLQLELASPAPIELLPRQAAQPGGGPEALRRARSAVLAARRRQAAYPGYGTALTNARAPDEAFERAARLAPDAEGLLTTAQGALGLSPRGCLRVLRVARTIADLEGSSDVRSPHVAEAVSYRARLPGPPPV